MTEKPQSREREREKPCLQTGRTNDTLDQPELWPQAAKSSLDRYFLFFFGVEVSIGCRCWSSMKRKQNRDRRKERRRNDFEWSRFFLLFTTCVFDSYRTATRRERETYDRYSSLPLQRFSQWHLHRSTKRNLNMYTARRASPTKDLHHQRFVSRLPSPTRLSANRRPSYYQVGCRWSFLSDSLIRRWKIAIEKSNGFIASWTEVDRRMPYRLNLVWRATRKSLPIRMLK